MKAYLIEVSLTSRILLPDDFDLEAFEAAGVGDAEVKEAALEPLTDRLESDLIENIMSLEEDLECPFDEEEDGL